MSEISENDLQIAKKSVFFGSLADNVFDEIISHSRFETLVADQILFREGDEAHHIYAVIEGLVKLSVTKRNGMEVVVDIFHTGTSFAEGLAFGNKKYPVSATALVKTKVIVAPNTVIQSVIRNNPDTFGVTLGATYAHLHRLIRQIEELKSHSGFERLGRYILARDAELGNTSEIELPYEKQVLASILGIKPETLSRALGRLKNHGVDLEGKIIRIRDRNALSQLLDGE